MRFCRSPPRLSTTGSFRAGGGTRTHFVRVTRAVPGPSSIAGIFFEQPVLVSSQLDRSSEPRSPPEGLARDSEPAAGLEPPRAPLQEGGSTRRAALALS